MAKKKKKRKRGGQPGNQNALKHGFYSRHFTRDETELIAEFIADTTLDHEIWLQRVLNRRLLEHSQEAETETLIKIAHALTVGTGRVARLLRDKRAISGKTADGFAGAIASALDELSSELGIDL